MIDMKEFISDLWLDKWEGHRVVEYLKAQADIVRWSPKVSRTSSSTAIGGGSYKVVELVDVNPTILRVPARYHNGVMIMTNHDTLLRIARWSSAAGEVRLHKSLFEDPHNAAQEEIEMLEMMYPELFMYAPLFHLVVKSGMEEAEMILSKEGKL